MIKLIELAVELFTMEKGKQNGLHGVKILIGCAMLYVMYQEHQQLTRVQEQITSIRHVLYWKFNIKTDLPSGDEGEGYLDATSADIKVASTQQAEKERN